MEKYKKIIEKYKHIILYIFFGGCTTLVNIISYAICIYIFNLQTVASNTAAWVMAVLFAYATNKLWVFDSDAHNIKSTFVELFKFMVSRVATGAVDLCIIYVTTDILGLHAIYMKIISNIVVIVLNYILSKLVIFKKRGYNNV